MKAHFDMFAAYNRWANELLYEVAGKLPGADYRADRGGFFKSVHGTLNHILVADRIWMRRFTGEGPTYQHLDDILFDQLPDLEAARREEDERIIAYIQSLTEGDLTATFTYRSITAQTETTQPLAPALAHFFNHQTHHRGQAHAILTAIGGRDAAPSMDLIYFQRTTGLGLA